jgi:hypothetical protein
MISLDSDHQMEAVTAFSPPLLLVCAAQTCTTKGGAQTSSVSDNHGMLKPKEN